MTKVVVIQARMSSSRLPNKMLMPLAGKPVLQHVYERAAMMPGMDHVVVATSGHAADDSLAAYCVQQGISLHRGSEEDVLDRFYHAAHTFKADIVIRVTGDCPLLDPLESTKVVEGFEAAPGCQYACNIEPPFLPDGYDTEVISFDTLAMLWRTTREPRYREHVTLYVRENLEQFNTVCLAGERDLSRLRLTLDREEDRALLEILFNRLAARGQFGYLKEVLALLEADPELLDLNRGIRRNEALQ